MENNEIIENQNEQNIDAIQSNNLAEQLNQFANEQSVIETNSSKNSVNKEETKIKTESVTNSNGTIVINLNTENDFFVKKKKIRTSDDKVYEIPCDYFKKSKLLSGLLEDYANDDDGEIPLYEVDSKNFELIIDYWVHYQGKEPKKIPKPFPESTDEEFLKSILDNNDNGWTYNFISKLSIEEAINLINFSAYLEIEGLVDLLAAKLAHEMCNCEEEEARQKFGIECDLTEDEYDEWDKYPF